MWIASGDGDAGGSSLAGSGPYRVVMDVLTGQAAGWGLVEGYGRAAMTGRPPRVFISYAHDDAAHVALVEQLWVFLIDNGIDARLDVEAAVQPQDWSQWMTRQLRAADFVLVVASPTYRERAEWEAPEGEGRGVRGRRI